MVGMEKDETKLLFQPKKVYCFYSMDWNSNGDE
jgi:hypothetical protein